MRFSNIILVLCIVAGTIALSGLGFWQLKRLAWKEGLIARVEENLKNAPLSLEDVKTKLKAGEDIEYRPVEVSGQFDHAKEQYFFATHKGRSGYYVYTPLKQANGEIVFVNRGFVPPEAKSPGVRLAGQISGETNITGLARSAPTDKPNSFVPDNDLKANVFYWKSLKQMRNNAYGDAPMQLAPVFVDANKAPNSGGFPVGGVTLIEFPNSHLQYAITWFGLAGTLLGVGGYFLWTRRKTT